MDFYLFWASAGQTFLCWPDNLLFRILLAFVISLLICFFRLGDYFD